MIFSLACLRLVNTIFHFHVYFTNLICYGRVIPPVSDLQWAPKGIIQWNQYHYHDETGIFMFNCKSGIFLFWRSQPTSTGLTIRLPGETAVIEPFLTNFLVESRDPLDIIYPPRQRTRPVESRSLPSAWGRAKTFRAYSFMCPT
jgi:hypothetical protein